MEKYLITFSSTYKVLKAEKVIKGRNIEFRLVPTPGKLISGCGLSIAFNSEDKLLITEVLQEKGIKIKACFVKRGKGYTEVELTN